MQAVDVLRHHSRELACTLQLGKLEVSLVWLGTQRDHLRAVELIELGSVRLEEVMGEHRLGRIGELLVIEAVYAAGSPGMPLAVETPAPPKNTMRL